MNHRAVLAPTPIPRLRTHDLSHPILLSPLVLGAGLGDDCLLSRNDGHGRAAVWREWSNLLGPTNISLNDPANFFEAGPKNIDALPHTVP
jgi:hypothetical protein